MQTDMGEYIVGAYLNLVLECNVVSYNVRPPGGKIKGLEETDVIGMNFKTRTCYLCEVTTHITGLVYENSNETVKRIKKKHLRMQKYAEECLPPGLDRWEYMFWSPKVRPGIESKLDKISGLDLVINNRYEKRVIELLKLATQVTHDTGNPVFRVLQILGHLPEIKAKIGDFVV
jgi:hypothetical protein